MIGQYANSPVLVALDNGLQNLFDDGQFVQNWYNVVFNLKTASGYGLDVWGKILNRSRQFIYNGNEYYLKGEQTIGGKHYTAEQMENFYRLILQITAMRYIGNASIYSINSILNAVFENYGKAYCVEDSTMQIRYYFEFYVDDVLKVVIETLNLHPTGVLVSGYEYLPIGEFMGFYIDDSSITYKGTWTATGQTDYSSIPLPVSVGDRFKVVGSATIGGISWNGSDDLVITQNVAVGGTITSADVSAVKSQPYTPFDVMPFYK